MGIGLPPTEPGGASPGGTGRVKKFQEFVERQAQNPTKTRSAPTRTRGATASKSTTPLGTTQEETIKKNLGGII